jgi:hypothetical protein
MKDEIVDNEMKIAGPFLSSNLSSEDKQAALATTAANIQPFLKLAFLVFDLNHRSTKVFSAYQRSKVSNSEKQIYKENDNVDKTSVLHSVDDINDVDNYKKDSSSSHSCNLREAGESHQNTTTNLLQMPDFSDFELGSLKFLFTCIGSGRCGTVLTGVIANGQQVAIKVSVFIF